MKLKYIKKFLKLEPLNHEYNYSPTHGKDELVTAFCLLNYIHGYNDIRDHLFTEIEENYYSQLKSPDVFKAYFEDYTNLLNKSVRNDKWINLQKDDPHLEYKTCYTKEDFKNKIKEHFNIEYNGFESIFDLLQNTESVFYLAFDWVDIGEEPSCYIKEQYGLYCFIKNEFIKEVKKHLDFFNNKLPVESSKKKEEDFKKYLWFKIGLSFAEGKPYLLKKENPKISFRKMAEELKFKDSNHPYFSQTFINTTSSDKNIYSRKDGIKKIIEHCQQKNINICEKFNSEINSK